MSTRASSRRTAGGGDGGAPAGGGRGTGGRPPRGGGRDGRARGARPARERAPRRGGGDLRARVLVAIPAIVFAAFIVAQGGIVFALGIAALGVIAVSELYGMFRAVRPVDLAGFLAVLALPLVALYGEPLHVVAVLAAAFPVTFFLAVARPWREHVAPAVAVTLFGVMWIGLPLAHAVFLRELPHGGALVLNTLVGVFAGDTVAYFAGRAWGQRRLAPWISPNKTVEGLVCGIVGGMLGFWAVGVGWQDWIAGLDALLIGFFVALVAPVGDLFESLVKRDLDVKDAGRFFGAHGGVLDRLDAALFALPVAYYASVLVL